MSLDLQGIREEICTQIRNQVGTSINVYPYLPLAPQYPCVGIRAAGDYVGYHETFDSGPGVGGLADVQMEVWIVESGDPENAGRFIDSMLSAGTGSSVIEALEYDQTLSGVVAYCVCMSAQMRTTTEPNAGLMVGVIRLSIGLNK